MDFSPEKESSEIKLIRSHIKTISKIEDPLWIFSGKPNNKQQNNDSMDNRFERYSIKNLLKLKSFEVENMIDNISPETLDIETHMLEYPFSAIGIISIIYCDNTNKIGCGTLIMPGVVITCANIFSNDENKEISKIKFFCNYDEIQCVFKLESEASGYFFPDEYENGLVFEDYAMLILKMPIGKYTGHFGILPFNNLDKKLDFNFCSFNLLEDENVIRYLEQKKIRKLEIEKNEANNNNKNTLSKKHTINNKSEFSYNWQDNKISFYDCPKELSLKYYYNFIDSNTYFHPNIYEGEIRLKENIIQHKYNLFNKIPGSPIFIEKENLSYLYLQEESMKNKNNPNFIYPSNNNLNLNSSKISINDNINSNKKDNTFPKSFQKPEYYLVGICTGKSDNIFNRATLICRKRFENIKDWIINYAKSSGKIQKQMVLNLESNYIDDLFVENIPKIDLEEITSLKLRNNTIRVDGVASIAQSNFKNLIELDLSKNDIKDCGLKIICESLIFKNLKDLRIADNNISRIGANYIVNSKIKSLKLLDIANNNIRADGVLNLFSGINKKLENLEFINLSNNKLLNQGIINLSESKFENIASIRNLNLASNQIINQGFIKFINCNKFYNLVSLNLSQNTLTSDSIKEFANSNFGNLKELFLSENKIGDEGAINLAHGKLYSLQILFIENCEMTDFGLFHILKGNFPYLENLNLKSNKITDKGAGMIIDSDLLFLKIINLEKNKIGSDGRMTLSRMKNCNIILE